MDYYKKCADAFNHGKLRDLKIYEYSGAYKLAMHIIEHYLGNCDIEYLTIALNKAREHTKMVNLMAPRSSKNNLTKAINQAHDERATELQCIYSAANAFSGMKNNKRQESGQYIATLLKNRGFDSAWKNQKQMSGFMMLMEHLYKTDEMFTTSIQNLSLSETFDNMLQADARYNDYTTKECLTAYNKVGDIYINNVEIKRVAQECLAYIFMAIDMHMYVTGTTAEFQEFLKTLRREMNTYTSLVNRRRNKRKHARLMLSRIGNSYNGISRDNDDDALNVQKNNGGANQMKLMNIWGASNGKPIPLNAGGLTLVKNSARNGANKKSVGF